jgi:hypothetical protein
MKILDKAAKLEKALLDRLARRTDIVRHPIEIYRAILDEIEDAAEPGARGARVFPYTAVTVTIPTIDAHQRATAEAVFSEPPSLEARIRSRLQSTGCRNVDGVSATVRFVDGAAEAWTGRAYDIEFRRAGPPKAARKTAKAAADESHELHLTVVAGSAAKSRYSFKLPRINLGRLHDVLDRQHRIVRQNQVAFADGDDDVSQSVSRAHAHLSFDVTSGEAVLHDDGSTHGTRVVRAGRTIVVPRSGRGLKLRDGDDVLLGQARVRLEVRRARTARTPATRRDSADADSR